MYLRQFELYLKGLKKAGENIIFNNSSVLTMNRGNKRRYWNTDAGSSRPPGLRGKQIGLYYRDLARNNPNRTKDHIINFSMPPNVLRKVKYQLSQIKKIVSRDKIDFKYISKLYSEIPEQGISVATNKDGDVSAVKTKPEVNEKTENVCDHSLSRDSIDEVIPKTESIKNDGSFKYGYYDIITGSFDEKLDESLSEGTHISMQNIHLDKLNELYCKEYVEMLDKPKYQEMMIFREKLPAYKKSETILETINSSQVTVISGETGCGKSTQVPQLILDNALINKTGANTKILVTQPRRIAASSLAQRVAEERAESIGISVGYAVRLDKVDPRTSGSIMFCTTGVLLSDLEVNQGLTNYSHIILDEVHERDTHIDLAMVLLKKILQKRKDFKVILMSATLDADRLSAYFDNCPMLHIEGLAYPVKDVYLEDIVKLTGFSLPEPQLKGSRSERFDMEKDVKHKAEVGPWLDKVRNKMDKQVFRTLLDYRIEGINPDLIISLLQHISKGEPGAVLIFVPGIGDITSILRSIETAGCFPKSLFEVYPLHSKLPTLQQKKIFERPPSGVRKIIVATNIAETSITIDDIVYVIDCGKIKLSGFNIEDNVSTLRSEWISQANLRQRRGRAGRCQPGICYHLILSHRAEILEERLLPELQRSNLLEPVLMVKKLRLGLAEEALKLVPDPPADTTIRWAVQHLQKIGALDDKEILTPLGWHLARLPVHPVAGKLLLFGALFGCLDRAASVAAVWGFKDPFTIVIGKEKLVDRMKKQLCMGEPSDHVAISEAIINWERCPRHARRSFAYDHFLSNNTLELLSEMKGQFANNLNQMGFLPSGDIKSDWENRNADNMSVFKAIVAASLYPNVGTAKWIGLRNKNPNKPQKITVRTPEDGKVQLHPSSVVAPVYGGPDAKFRFNNPGANWCVYWLKQKSTMLFLFEITVVYTLPLMFFGELAASYDKENSQNCFISISEVKVRCQRETAELILEMRALLDHVLASKVSARDNQVMKYNHFEEQVLDAVIELITAEDERADYEDSDTDNSENEYQRRRWNR